MTKALRPKSRPGRRSVGIAGPNERRTRSDDFFGSVVSRRTVARTIAILVSMTICAGVLAQPADVGCGGPLVATTVGEVCGDHVVVGAASVDTFLGIPYGEDTTGGNRFLAPVPREPWSGVLEAHEPGPACPQTLTSLTEAPEGQSEDCLYLNVWAPTERGEPPAPVLVFIHGGGFLVGTATDSPASADGDWFNIDGRFLAADHGLVVVTMNYRLAAFGFLAGAAGLEGNQGLLDQQLHNAGCTTTSERSVAIPTT
ncbi:MAG TPA: carboxylesterase family protein [Trueperaceae bacterium]|nr:carboxylesterase family protein [Trueperaceae bacterium]